MKRAIRFFIIISILIGLSINLATIAKASPVNLVVNGGFEFPYTPSMLWVPSGTPGMGWSVTSVATGLPSCLEIQHGLYQPVIEGAQYAELNGPEVDTIYQTISTVPHDWYEIRFAFSPRPWTLSYENQVAVLWSGTIIGVVGPTSGTTANVWNYFDYYVEALSDATEIRFTSLDPYLADSSGAFLDDVSVTQLQPHTTLQTVTATPNTLAAGGGQVTINVTDKNDGPLPISCAYFNLSGSPPFAGSPNKMTVVSSSDNNLVTMNPNAAWTYTATVPITAKTIFTVIGYGVVGDIDVTGPSETGNVTVNVPYVPASSNWSIGILMASFAGLMIFLGKRKPFRFLK